MRVILRISSKIKRRTVDQYHSAEKRHVGQLALKPPQNQQMPGRRAEGSPPYRKVFHIMIMDKQPFLWMYCYDTAAAMTQKIARLTTVRMEQTPEATVWSSSVRPRLGAR